MFGRYTVTETEEKKILYKVEESVINRFFSGRYFLSNLQIFLTLLAINVILSWIFQEVIMTREVYHSLLSGRLENYRIDKQIELINRFKIWGYLFLPVVLWLKFAIVSLLLQLPLMIKFIEIPFRKIFRVVMIASVSFLIMNSAYIIYLSALPAAEITQGSLNMIPLSISSIINISSYPESAVKMLSSFNLFEMGWVLLIYCGFVVIAAEKLKKFDVLILVIGVWSFLLVFKYALLIYMDKIFG